MYTFKFKNYSLSVGGRTLIKSCNVTLPCTGMTLVTGDNGVGKTSMLLSIMKKVTYTGIIEHNYKKITYLPVDNFVDVPDLTTPHDIMELKQVMYIREMPPFFSIPIKNLSSGQKKKFCILNAIQGQPDCILLDEPFSHLDKTGRRDIFLLLRKIARYATVILCDHCYGDMTQYFDNVIHIKEQNIHVCLNHECIQGSFI